MAIAKRHITCDVIGLLAFLILFQYANCVWHLTDTCIGPTGYITLIPYYFMPINISQFGLKLSLCALYIRQEGTTCEKWGSIWFWHAFKLLWLLCYIKDCPRTKVGYYLSEPKCNATAKILLPDTYISYVANFSIILQTNQMSQIFNISHPLISI